MFRQSQKKLNPASLTAQAPLSRDALNGEWRVKCGARIYNRGNLVSSTEDNDASLVVAETDSDGSYRLYRFPTGFGEAFPRVRKVSSNQFAGDDAVRGITILVKQSVDIESDRITIRQTTIDTPSNQTQSEITCTGTRPQSALSLSSDSEPEICQSGPVGDHPYDKRLARLYRSVRPFSDGMAAVAIIPRGGRSLKWGYVDETRRLVIPTVYDVVTPFHGGLAVVGKSHGRGQHFKWGVVEKLGPQVTSHTNYDGVKILGEGFAAVGYAIPGRKGLRWNLINRENTTILHGFDDFGCFVNGRARASYTDSDTVRRGHINKVGDFIADEK